jgi:outer membrane protein TolC
VITRLELLIRHYPQASLQLADHLPSLPPQIDAGIPAELLSRRPDIRAAQRSLQAAGLRVEAAELAYLPSISLTGSTGSQSNALSDLLDGDFGTWSIAGQLMQPFFPLKNISANIAAAESTQLIALYQYTELALIAFSEVENALTVQEILRERENALTIASSAAKESERIAMNRYQQGLTPFLNVLDAQKRALDTQSSLIATRRARLDNRVNLHLALGGGFEPESKPNYRSTQR